MYQVQQLMRMKEARKSFDTVLIADSFMKYLSYFLFLSKFSPHYTENTLYARKWMVRLLLRLVSRTDYVNNTIEEISVGNKQLSLVKSLLKEDIESLFIAYLKKESIVNDGDAGPGLVLEVDQMTKMVCDLLDGITALDGDRLASLSSLTPTLSACIQINDRAVRTSIQNLLQKMFSGPLADRLREEK